MDDFTSNQVAVFEACLKELMNRRLTNGRLKDFINGVESSEDRGFNSKYGR